MPSKKRRISSGSGSSVSPTDHTRSAAPSRSAQRDRDDLLQVRAARNRRRSPRVARCANHAMTSASATAGAMSLTRRMPSMSGTVSMSKTRIGVMRSSRPTGAGLMGPRVSPGTRRSTGSGRRDRRRRRRSSRRALRREMRSATAHAPPAEMPQKMPSSRASRRAMSSAVGLDTFSTRSTRAGSKIFGRYACGHLRMPGIASPPPAARRRSSPPASSPSGTATRR